MAGSTLTIQMVQPRMMSLKQAADYVGLPQKRFPIACPVSPIAMPGDRKLYDVRDLDAWVDAMKAGAKDSDDAILDKLG